MGKRHSSRRAARFGPSMNRLVLSLAAAPAVVSLAGPAWATPTIVVGDYTLAPDQSNQQVQIFVHGGDAVEGLNLNVQIANGGQSPGYSISGAPVITGLDILNGTIFRAN